MISFKASSTVVIIISLSWVSYGEISSSRKYTTSFNNLRSVPDTTVHKVTLTQKGYIQFLKYITNVPTITDFTFCIWLRSENLTYPHPLLSYSKHEEERYIRAWISNHGKDVNMEILENHVFQVPINIRENHWHHICASWSTKKAEWAVYLNGKLKESGFTPVIRGLKIPKGGDIVVGQEYTDFDKGLDDGIEGDIYGFNFLLAPATLQKSNDISRRYYTFDTLKGKDPTPPHHTYEVKEDELLLPQNVEPLQTDDIPDVLSYFKATTNREPKGIFEFGQSFLQNIHRMIQPNQRLVLDHNEYKKLIYPKANVWPSNVHYSQINPTKRFSSNELDIFVHKPLGLTLVELAYGNCALGKGAPITDERVLVSWTKTPVRVFGGAILKNIRPFCMRY